jgi:hypothetical protein
MVNTNANIITSEQLPANKSEIRNRKREEKTPKWNISFVIQIVSP